MSHRDSVRETERPPASAEWASGRLPHPFALTWRDGCFLHWPVDPGALRPRIPDPLALDTRDGSAWISVLPFVLAKAGLRASPGALRLTAPELNVRTYVTYRGDPGLFFLSIDVDSAALATAAGRFTRLPVRRARMHVSRTDDQVSFASARESADEPVARFAASYAPADEASYPERGSLEAWLTERRRFYAPSRGGVLVGEVAHAPWPLRPANVTLYENTMVAANRLPAPTDGPTAHYCERLAMTASIPRRLRAR